MSTDLPPLSPSERRMLLGIARAALAARLEDREPPALPPPTPGLQRHRAVFVTLRQDGALRGCIGITTPDRSLAGTVAVCAVAAATEDPRFPPLHPADLGRVRLEISALGPFQRVHDPASIVAGRHGVMITLGTRRALLLPQVAIEEGWDRDTLLEHVCRKAGLPPGAWRGQAELERFEAEVFAEADGPVQ